MDCAACHKKMQLISGEIDIYFCVDGCGGVWLDQKNRLRLSKLKEFPEELMTEKIDISDDPLQCSECSILLRRHRCQTNVHVYINECYQCGGVFYRAGALQQVFEHPMTEEQIEAFQMELLAEVPEYILEKERLEQQAVINKLRKRKWSIFLPNKWFGKE